MLPASESPARWEGGVVARVELRPNLFAIHLLGILADFGRPFWPSRRPNLVGCSNLPPWKISRRGESACRKPEGAPGQGICPYGLGLYRIRAGRIGLRIWPSADCFLLAEAVQAGGHRWPEPSWVRNRRGRIATGRRATALKVKRTTGVRGRVGVRSARAASKFRAWTPRARPSARVPIATGIFPHPASSTRRCGEGAREIVGDARAWEDRIARWDRSAASA